MTDLSIKNKELNRTWDSLSLAEKSQIMKTAVENGLTSLSEIKNHFNEFAKGGSISRKEESTEDIGNMPWYEVYPNPLGNTYAFGGNLYGGGGPVRKDHNYTHVTSLYQALIDRGIPPQAALELTNQQVAEGGWNAWYTGDGKRYPTHNGLADHIASWMTKSYPDTIKAKNFDQFFNGLQHGKNGSYNNKPEYKPNLLNTRPGVKRRINAYRAEQGLPPLTLLNDNPYVPTDTTPSIVTPQENLVEPIESNIAAYGGELKRGGRKKEVKNYDDWSKKLSNYWHEDLNAHDYDYEKYYNDDPREAYRQLNHILAGGEGHFPDEGRSGIYKKSIHPTYPDLEEESWSDNSTKFPTSDRQLDEESSNRIFAYGGNLFAKGGKKNSYSSGNTARALSYLTSRGLSQTGASAIVGVLQAESNLIPSIRAQAKGDNGEGIAQWTGSRKNVFWNTLEKIEPGARKRYGSIVNVPLERQLDVVLKERPTITRAIHNAKDLSTATDIMLRGYENGGGTLGTMISKDKMDQVYSKWGNGYTTQMNKRLRNAYNLLGMKYNPSAFTFLDSPSRGVSMPGIVADNTTFQVPLPTEMSTDPTTFYKAPTIDLSALREQPSSTPKDVVVYDPKVERSESMQVLNNTLGLLGQGSLYPKGLSPINNSPQGLLAYVNSIYN